MEAGRSYSLGAARHEADPLAPGLHVVATPIGNMGDVTLRALSTLAAADLVLCEDTRLSARLMERYAIRTRLSPYHEHNARKVRPAILARLKQGAAIALISDAGMPLVSDPGYRLVKEAADMGIAVTACPGPSAVLTALALSGLPTDRFLFAGFIPQKQGERRRLFAEFARLRATLVFFESPHRVVDTLADLEAAMPGRAIALCRELTKLHEEVLRGSPATVAAILGERHAVKGEITLVVGPPQATAEIDPAALDAAIADALKAMPASKAASEIARRFGLNRAEVYSRILAARDDDEARERARSEAAGRSAERIALWYLRLKGYRLLAWRYRSGAGEIDLVMRRGQTTAFIEVKTRASPDGAVEAVTNRQSRRISAAARSFMAADPVAARQFCRFDIVAVSPYHWPRHIENAFYGDG